MAKKTNTKQTQRPEEELSPTLPHAPDVERTLLGMVFLENLMFHEMVAAGLKADHFHVDSNRKIFRGMQVLVEEKKSLDIITVMHQLEKSKELQIIGGAPYLSSLVDGVPDQGGNVNEYVEIVRDKAMRRSLVHIANRSTAMAMDESDPVKWTLAGMQDDLLRLQGDTVNDGSFVKEFSDEVLETVRAQMHMDRETIGLPFGIAELDELTTGIREGELCVIGGFPASGKTAFAVDTARKVCKAGHPVAMFSIEMRRDEIIPRLWAQEAQISYAKLRNPRNLMSQELREIEANWKPAVDKLPLIIDDRAKHISEIIPRAHLYIRRHGVKLIIVDFLQIVQAPGEKEYDRVSYAADALTELAKTTKVPVVVLSQLTRAEDKKHAANLIPTMQMLRSSGKIEQNAHLILFTYRPEDDNGKPTGLDMIVIGKQRAGLKGRVKAYFSGLYQTWDQREETTAPAQASLPVGEPVKKSK